MRVRQFDIIEDEGGKIDLNAAGEPLLTGLFVSLGASEGAAAALADWRDADDLTRRRLR